MLFPSPLPTRLLATNGGRQPGEGDNESMGAGSQERYQSGLKETRSFANTTRSDPMGLNPRLGTP